MANFKPRIHPGKYVNTKGHWMTKMDFKWFVESSNRKSSYHVEMQDKGFLCSCPARVRCKHISKVEQLISGPV